MAWKPVPDRENQYTCLSTDTEPTNLPINSVAIELDTGKIKYWDGTGPSWPEVGGST